MRLAFYWTALPALAVAWSFNLSSFQHAKEIVLVLAVLPALLFALRDKAPVWPALKTFSPLFLLLLLQILHLALPGRFTQPFFTWEQIARTTTIIMFVIAAWDLMAKEDTRAHLVRATVLGATLCAVLALLQRVGALPFLFPAFNHYDQKMYSVFGNQGGLGAMCAIGLVVLIASPGVRFRWLSVVVALVLFGTLLLSGARSAWIALAVGIVAAGFQRVKLSTRHSLLFGATGLSLVALVLIFAPEIRAKWMGGGIGEEARLWFWRGSLGMIRDSPVFGHGLGSFAYASPLYLGRALGTDWQSHFHNELQAFHAHNDFLEILAETGIVGGVLLALQALMLLRRHPVSLPPIAVCLVIAVFNAAWFNTPLAIIALLFAAPRAPLPKRVTALPAQALLVGFAVLAAGFYSFSVLAPSYLRAQASSAHTAGHPDVGLYARSWHYPWPDYLAAEYEAIAHIDAGQWDKARHALDRARQGLDTGRVHLLSARVAEAQGRRDDALRHYRAVLERWPWHAHARARLEAK